MLSVDFHTHILSGIDDGSPSLDESLEMIYQLMEQGIKTIFLTPHFNPQKNFPDVFLAERTAALQALMEKLNQLRNAPQLLAGAEVYFSPGMSRWEKLADLALGNTGYILIEMPDCRWSDRMLRELELIYLERKLIPVIAHVERYLSTNGTRTFFDELLDMPVLLQVNASFINEKRTRRQAYKLLKTSSVHLIGSDCHGASWRVPNIGQARKLITEDLTQDVIAHLLDMENAVLNGCNIFVK